MGRFIAFKLKKGDSFYLETRVHNEKKSVLVDGGDGEHVSKHFKSTIGENKKINVVVCTHKDSDHAKGIMEILKSVECDEVWLPAEWGDLASAFIKNNLADFYESIISLLKNYETTREEEKRLEAEGSRSNTDERENEDENIIDIYNFLKERVLLSNIASIPRLINGLQKKDLGLLHSTMTYNKLTYAGNYHTVLSKEMNERLTDILGHYDNIKYIANIALEKGVKIRWFVYRKYAPLKINADDPLIPLNSKEVLKMRPLNAEQVLLELVMQFVISEVNRKSLVFSSRWNYKKNPPVLFTADSNLEGRELLKAKFRDGMIITTPHHGSFNNTPAFEKIRCKITANEIVKTKWVRGHNSDVKLDDWYLKGILAIKGSTRRYCTKCETNHIQFRLRKGQWKQVHRKRNGDICNCT